MSEGLLEISRLIIVAVCGKDKEGRAELLMMLRDLNTFTTGKEIELSEGLLEIARKVLRLRTGKSIKARLLHLEIVAEEQVVKF